MMERRSRYPLQLMGVTVGVLIALLIFPATRWIVGAQLASVIPGRASAFAWSGGVAGCAGLGSEESAQATHRVAATMPDDYAVQLADALTARNDGPVTTEMKISRLRGLAMRFPDQASVYANSLRFATQGAVMVRRDEEFAVVQDKTPPNDHYTGRKSIADDLLAYDRDAAQGERLDPDNAFFPLMRSVGLFAAHRDTEARAALHRAAQRPLWREYYDDELDGKVRLQSRTFGESGALPRTVLAAELLLPQYAQIRAVARMAVATAMQAETAGRFEEGVAIREDLLRCGGLVRTEAQSLIGSFVGSSVTQMALQRPAGAPITRAARNADGPQGPAKAWDRLLTQYDAFLQRVGHPEQSARAHSEAAAGLRTREIAARIRDFGPFGPALWQLGMAWWANVLLLCAVVVMIALGSAAAGIYSSRAVRRSQGLPQWAARGAGLGVFGALASGVIMIPVAVPPTAMWVTAVAGFGLLALALPAASWALRVRTLSAYVVGLVISGVVIMLAACYAGTALEPIRKIVLYVCGMSSGGESADPGFDLLHIGGSTPDLIYHLLSVIGLAIVPVLAALVFVVVARFNHVSISIALVRGFRGCAVPIACVLFLVYAALLPVTLRLESSMDEGIRNMVRHEGRYFAQMAGEEWPGRTP